MRILKYELDIIDNQKIKIGNLYALPIAVAEQNGKLVMWTQTSTPRNSSRENEISVDIFGAGHPIEIGLSKPYIGTVLMSNGLVWHVYALWGETEQEVEDNKINN